MMDYAKTQAHAEIALAIRETLKANGLCGLRADDKEYHEDLYWNVITYCHGCGFGIAVYDRLESDAPNHNVGLEVGYMQALRKRVCLLKDKTLVTLPADIVGKLYKPFDPQDPRRTIAQPLDKWLHERGMV